MAPVDVLNAFANRAGRWPSIIPEPDRQAARSLARMRPEIVTVILDVAGRWREFRADVSMIPAPRQPSLAWIATNWRTAYRWLRPEVTGPELDALVR